MTGKGASKERMADMEAKLDSLNAKVIQNSSDIAINLRLIRKEKLEREMEGLKGKFVVRGYEWTKGTFTGNENSMRRKFIRQMARKVFVDSGLMTFEEWKGTEFPDCKPVFWDKYASFHDKLTTPLIIQFADRSLWHGIKGSLSGKRDLAFPIREALPRILDKAYDDALKYRRVLLNAKDTKTLYIDLKPSAPYIQLMEKTLIVGPSGDNRTVRTAIPIKWSDPRFGDPVAHHDEFRSLPNEGSSNLRGGHRGRGRGGRGGAGGRANGDGTGSDRASRSQSRSQTAAAEAAEAAAATVVVEATSVKAAASGGDLRVVVMDTDETA
jgi:hypothetical protein